MSTKSDSNALLRSICLRFGLKFKHTTKESNCKDELERKRHTYVCLAKEEEAEEEEAEEEAGERLLRNIMYPRGSTTPAIMIATPIRYLPGDGGSIYIFYLLTTRLPQIRSATFLTVDCNREVGAEGRRSDRMLEEAKEEGSRDREG